MSAHNAINESIEAFNRHDAEAFAALYAEDAIAHDPQYSEPLHGRDAIRKDIEDFFRAFPDVSARPGSFLVNGDTAAFEFEVSGTHQGPLVTPTGDIPATNRPMTMRVGRFMRVNGEERIAECNRYYDLAGVMQQLGLMEETP